MKANLITKKIEITKKEAVEAGNINSEKFNELQNYLAAYPTFEIKIVPNPRRKAEFKDLNYDYMKKYIKNCNKPNRDDLLDEFITLTASEKDAKQKGCEAASYTDVKKWFLKNFPEIKEYKENHKNKVAEIMEKVA